MKSHSLFTIKSFRMRNCSPFKALVVLSMIMPAGADKVDLTGRLSEEFKGFSISLVEGEEVAAKAFLYEFPNNTLEVLSKQNLIGVIVLFKDDGSILSVKPKVAEVRLPDQVEVNKFVDAEKPMSELLQLSKFDAMDPIQTFGLLTKWATSVLSANDDVELNLNLSEGQTEIIVKLLSGNIEWPENPSDLPREKIKALAMKIVRIEDLKF